MVDLTTSVDHRRPRNRDELLAARAQLLARPLEDTSRDDLTTQLVGFDAGEGRFALPMGSVVTVLNSVRPTPLPEQPPWLAGAIGVSGQILAVIEPDRFLGASPALGDAPERSTMVVISDGTADVALLVDRLARTDVLELATAAALPDGTPDLVAHVVRGTVGGRHLLDAAGLVAAIRAEVQPSTDQASLRQIGAGPIPGM
jgi:purine-binding chemotaxis protein CheW